MQGSAVSETTPRQVLYGLVAGAFLAVVVTLIIGGAVAGLVPTWWSALMASLVLGSAIWTAFNWRRTGRALGLSIGLFVVWMIGTLVLRV